MSEYNSNLTKIILILIITNCRAKDDAATISVASLEEDVCLQPIDEGDCGSESDSSSEEDDNSTIVFGYNINTTKCEEFDFDGCEGNQNRFETAADCWKACYTPLNYFLARVADLLTFKYLNVTTNANYKLQ